jgi:hypothetical protein
MKRKKTPKKQNKEGLIPKIPFTTQEIETLARGMASNDLQSKIMNYSKSSSYQFLSQLTVDRIKTPIPGTKLTKKEMQLFNEYVKYRSSMQYKIFQFINNLIMDYNHKLSMINQKEDAEEYETEEDAEDEDPITEAINKYTSSKKRVTDFGKYGDRTPGVA